MMSVYTYMVSIRSTAKVESAGQADDGRNVAACLAPERKCARETHSCMYQIDDCRIEKERMRIGRRVVLVVGSGGSGGYVCGMNSVLQGEPLGSYVQFQRAAMAAAKRWEGEDTRQQDAWKVKGFSLHPQSRRLCGANG